MNRLEFYRQLARKAETRILYYVVDGLGGLPRAPGEPTELEAASTSTFDRLARQGATGLITPVLPGVAPGSGPAHLALFGYEPTEVIVGRGVLAALGIGVELQAGDVAARINFCTLDDHGNITDRRAGRIATEEAVPLTERLDGIELSDGVELAVHHVEQYRACLVLRGSGLDGRIADTDPQVTGVPPDAPEPLHPEAKAAAELAAEFLAAAHELLAGEPRANGILLRGFDTYRPIPGLGDLYGLKPAAIAAYPMYRGVARLAGMTCFDVEDDPDAIVAAVAEARAEHDFLFVHYKATDSRGEDGNFEGKVSEIEKGRRADIPSVGGRLRRRHGHRRPLDAGNARGALVAPCAAADPGAGLSACGGRRDVRRDRLPARQPRDAAQRRRVAIGVGARRPFEEVRSLVS